MAKAKRFGEGLTDKQMKLARIFEEYGLCSISQAVKAFQRRDNVQIETWKRQLTAAIEARREQERRALESLAHPPIPADQEPND